MRDLDADPFPSAGEEDEVAAELALYAPICAPAPIAMSPIEFPLSLTIDLTIEPGADLVTVRSAIIENIQNMLLTRVQPQADIWTLYKSWVSEAISLAVGELDHKLTFPIGDWALPAFTLPTLDPADVTWL